MKKFLLGVLALLTAQSSLAITDFVRCERMLPDQLNGRYVTIIGFTRLSNPQELLLEVADLRENGYDFFNVASRTCVHVDRDCNIIQKVEYTNHRPPPNKTLVGDITYCRQLMSNVR